MFPPAATFLDSSQPGGEPSKLLTPFQLLLTLNLSSNGSLLSVWDWIHYRRKHAASAIPISRPVSNVAKTAAAATFFGFTILAAETWFHFQPPPSSSSKSPITANYSFALPALCHGGENISCLYRPDIRGGTLINGLAALQALNNISATTSLNRVPSSHPSTIFLGTPQNGLPAHHDFTATTFAIRTLCMPTTRACGLFRENLTSGISVPFCCHNYPALCGNLLDTGLNIHFFTDSSRSDNSSYDSLRTNPYYLSANGHTLQVAGNALSIGSDPEVVVQEFGGVGYVLFCNATIYEAEYPAINDSITKLEAKEVNDTVASMVTMPSARMAGGLKMQNDLNLGALGDSVQDLADAFADSYSEVVLGLVAGALERAQAGETQERSERIVSRVGTASLVVFAASVVMFLGLALASARMRDVEEVKARLSFASLVGERFEGARALSPLESVDEVLDEKRWGLRRALGLSGRDRVDGGMWCVFRE